MNNPYIGTGVIGLTLIWPNNQTGEIQEADIFFNDADFVFSTTQETNITVIISETGELRFLGFINLLDVAVHEMGHFVGLGHSFVDGALPDFGQEPTVPDPSQIATMYPYLVNGSRARNLKKDDRVGISHLYPTAGFKTDYGVIEGKIVSAMDPRIPVFGAHVVAVNTARQEIIGAISLRDGRFLIDGVEPGVGYTFFAEPIPFLQTLQPFFADAEQEFPPELYDDAFNWDAAQPVPIIAGRSSGPLTHTVLVGFLEGDRNEPNDSFSEFTDANPDIKVSGVLNQEDPSNPDPDRDIFRFRALRGSRVRMEVSAQRLNTMLEPLLILYDSEGNEITRNSNYFGLDGDARIDFPVPQGGFYFVEVADRTGKQGPGYFYQLEIKYLERVQPIMTNSSTS